MQLQTFLDDPMYREEHSLHVELIGTFARVGPNAEPKFRDECEYGIVFIDSKSRNEPLHEKRNNLGFRPGQTQISLYSLRSRLAA